MEHHVQAPMQAVLYPQCARTVLAKISTSVKEVMKYWVSSRKEPFTQAGFDHPNGTQAHPI